MPEFSRQFETILALPDPFHVRQSTAEVVKNSRLVTINPDKLDSFAHQLSSFIKTQPLLDESQFGQLNNTPQKIFVIDTANFCFWAEKDQDKWQVEYPPGHISDGWPALVACFDRALSEKIPLLDSRYLANLSPKQAQHLFRSSNRTTIPLIDKRLEFLRQAGQILEKQFSGQFNNLLQQADHDAVKLIQLIINHFPSFNDTADFMGQLISFYKRAQICAYDLSLLPGIELKNLDQLTMFADYKMPQTLRALGVLQYADSLADKVNNFILIFPSSREEVEIRSATIWVGELLAQQLDQPPVIIDNAIWSFSQTLTDLPPYHRTLSPNY